MKPLKWEVSNDAQNMGVMHAWVRNEDGLFMFRVGPSLSRYGNSLRWVLTQTYAPADTAFWPVTQEAVLLDLFPQITFEEIREDIENAAASWLFYAPAVSRLEIHGHDTLPRRSKKQPQPIHDDEEPGLEEVLDTFDP